MNAARQNYYASVLIGHIVHPSVLSADSKMKKQAKGYKHSAQQSCTGYSILHYSVSKLAHHASNMPNSVCSSWISTKYRTLYYLYIRSHPL